MKGIESYVNCPECGELIRIILERNEEENKENVLDKMIMEMSGKEHWKSESFITKETKCRCGKNIETCLTVIAWS